MKSEDVMREFDGVSESLILVVGYPDHTDLIRRSDAERWEKLCAAHARGGRAVGVITVLSDFRTRVRVLPPFPEAAARPYLEKLAAEIAWAERKSAARVN